MAEYDPVAVEEEWRMTPTDLGGWANRAAQALQEVKRLRALLDEDVREPRLMSEADLRREGLIP